MAASKARSDMKELQDITSELKRLQDKTKELKDKKKNIETSIQTYLDKTNQPGIKYENIVVLAKERKKRDRKPQKEKQDEIIRLLENNGISDSKGLYQKIQDAMKGDVQVVQGIEIKESKKLEAKKY